MVKKVGKDYRQTELSERSIPEQHKSHKNLVSKECFKRICNIINASHQSYDEKSRLLFLKNLIPDFIKVQIVTYSIQNMQKAEKQKIFEQFRLAKVENLDITTTSKYEKVNSYTKGCMSRRNKNLYQSNKTFIQDLQVIMNYDPQSANIIFKDYPEIKYSYNQAKKEQNLVKVQCNRCGQFTAPARFCPTCNNAHYCSEVCQYNIKLTHEKEECRIKCYPKIHHQILIEVHFGTNLGHNLQVYFQHEMRAYALVRGKQIIKKIYQYFTGIKKATASELQSDSRRGRIEQKLMGYKVELKNGDKYVEFQKKDEKQYPTGVLKVDLDNLDTLKRIYEQNQILEEIQLFLIGEGALMSHCTEQIHNNHAHWVYIFRMP